MRKTRTIFAAATASLIVLAGCASGPEAAPGGDPSAEDELTPITVGVIPSSDVASIYVGVAEGFFEEEGLDVNLEIAQGGAAIVPAVVSGEYQFGFSNITSLLLGVSNGVPLRAVASGPFTAGVERDYAALVVPPSSTVESLSDLAGKTVAVNALHNFTEILTRNAIDQAGGDADAVNFVEVAIPELPAALAANQVDAAYIAEPALTRVIEQGSRAISYPSAETDPELMVAGYFTSLDFAAESPEVVEAFTTAMGRAADFAQENPDAIRAALTEYLEIDDALLQTIALPRYSSEFSEDSFQIQADLALKYGLVTAPVDFSTLLP